MQALIQQLKAQHRELLRLAAEVERVLRSGDWREDPGRISGALEALSEALARHLAVEDERFYPEAGVHPVGGELARRHRAELGHLKQAFGAYEEAWAAPSSRGADPIGFTEYTEALLRFLRRRIETEEGELYPALGGDGAEGLP